MRQEEWVGYAQVEQTVCCRWCPLLAPEDAYDRKASMHGYCNVIPCTIDDFDGIDPDYPGNVVVEALK